tara:strand:- start:10857 stop:11705 length:849 start_codon:yes stop_codon:yes gene_type:complete
MRDHDGDSSGRLAGQLDPVILAPIILAPVSSLAIPSNGQIRMQVSLLPSAPRYFGRSRNCVMSILTLLIPLGLMPMHFAQAQQDPFGSDTKPAATPATQPPMAADSDAIEQQLRGKLSEKTSIHVNEASLNEFLHLLSEKTNTPMVLDTRALEEIGLSPQQPIHVSLQNASLRTVLKISLRPLDLTYMIKDEVIQITTLEHAENHLVTKVYALADPLKDKAAKVIRAVTSTVIPDTWEVLGGPSTIVAIESVLVVSTTEETHEQIDSLLRKIETAMQTGKTR